VLLGKPKNQTSSRFGAKTLGAAGNASEQQ